MKKFILCAIFVLFGISTSYAVGSGSVWIIGKNVITAPKPWAKYLKGDWLTSGANIYQWNDSTGAGHHATQGTLALQPTVAPDGSARFYYSSLEVAPVRNVSLVAKMVWHKSTQGLYGMLFGVNPTLDGWTLLLSAAENPLYYRTPSGAWFFGSIPIVGESQTTVGFSVGSYDFRQYCDGQYVATSTTVDFFNGSEQACFIGGRGPWLNTGEYGLRADISELWVYNRVLTKDEFDLVRSAMQ